MEPKKAPQSNLEHKRTTNFFIGTMIALSLVLISFEWTSTVDIKRDIAASQDLEFEIDLVTVTRRDVPKPKAELPIVKKVIDIVDYEIEFEEFDFDSEVTKGTKYKFVIDPDDPGDDIPDDPIPFVNVEDKPQFNGGDPNTEFARYVARNLRYPEIAAENGISGRVIIQFVIDETGNLVDLKILRSVDPALDAEAIRVLYTSPKWIPGRQRNKPVKVSYVFPFNFVLQ